MTISTPGFDERYTNNLQYPIARGHKQSPVSVTVIDGQTSGEQTFAASGQLLGFVYEAPNLTTDTAFTVEILDMDNVSWYSKSGLPDNGKGIIWVIDTSSRFLAGQHKCKISYATAAQGANRTFTIVPILK